MSRNEKSNFWSEAIRQRREERFLVEASGVRTMASVIVPLVLGQALGHPGIGLLIGMGGMQLSFIDFAGAKPPTLFWGILATASAAFLGALASQAAAPVAVVLMFVVAFAMAFLAVFGAVAGNAGFVLSITYAFAQSLPVSRHTATDYFVNFGLGSLWGALLTLLVWRLRPHETADIEGSGDLPESGGASWAAVKANLTLHSLEFQHAMRSAVAATAAVAICRFFHPPHGFWLILSSLIILKPDFTATRVRTAQRLIGTTVGGLIAVLPALYVHNVFALDALIAVFGAIAFSLLPRNYGLYALFLTPFVVLLSAFAEPGSAGVAFARIGETLLGGGMSFLIAFLLRSPRCYLPILRPVPNR